MVKKLMQKIGAIILLGVFCIYITPRDYLHHFASHHDTQDEVTIPTDDLSFSTAHKHCEWLHWTVEAYVDAPVIGLPSTPHIYKVSAQELPAYHYTYPPYFFSLRAPPHASA